MSERDLPLLLEDIKVAIAAILEYTRDYNFERYEADLKRDLLEEISALPNN